MATAILSVERLDWISQPVHSVAELLPIVMESRREIVRDGYEFVLGCGTQPIKYFVKFRDLRAGRVLMSPFVDLAARVSSVHCALSFYAFIQRETGASPKDFFVEAVKERRNQCLSPRPIQRNKKLIKR
jgi:hypothetical protein